MKNETINQAIPLENAKEKEDWAKTILIAVGLLIVLILILWLVSCHKEGTAVIILAEMLPLMEGL